MRIKHSYIIILMLSFLSSHPVVENLDIEQFMGRWYVIALVPNWIEDSAINSYDDYVLNSDGTIDITYKAVKDGKERTIRQKGIVSENPGRWKIKFIEPWVPFFTAPYEVIMLEEDYNYMVVGYPDNSYGWIMSRKNTMDSITYDYIVSTLEKEFGYLSTSFKKVTHK